MKAANNEPDFADVFDADVSSDDEEGGGDILRTAQTEVDRIGRMTFAESDGRGLSSMSPCTMHPLEELGSGSESESEVDEEEADYMHDDDDDKSTITVDPILLLGREFLDDNGFPPMQRMGKMDPRVREIARRYSAKLVKIIDPLLLDPRSDRRHP